MKVLIGTKGEVKADLEDRTKTRISIEDTSVTVETLNEDYLSELAATNVVHAIGRGFNPDIAFMLLQEDYVLEVIPLRDYVGSVNAMERVKGRVIGEKGKSRKTIEELSEAYISVYGKTISLIGSYDAVDVAREAVLMLIEGARHATVYRFLEKSRSQRNTPFPGSSPASGLEN